MQPGESRMFILSAIAAWIVTVVSLVLSRMVAADAFMLACQALAATAGLAALHWTATIWFYRCNTETDVTNIGGVHKRRTFETSLDKVESIDDRLMKIGRRHDEGSQSISSIASPLVSRNAITTRSVGT
jgi:hypothetical protein